MRGPSCCGVVSIWIEGGGRRSWGEEEAVQTTRDAQTNVSTPWYVDCPSTLQILEPPLRKRVTYGGASLPDNPKGYSQRDDA